MAAHTGRPAGSGSRDAAGGARVLRVITRLNIGGPGLHVLTLSRALTDFPSLVACGRPDEDEGKLDATGVDLAPVPLVRPLSPRQDLEALRAIRALISQWRPAVVESHMAKAGFAARAAALSLRHRPASIHVFHGHVFDGYFSKPAEKGFVAAERFLASRTDILVTVSEQTRDSLLGLGIGRPEQYRIIPLGFDLAPFLAVSGPSGSLRTHLGLGPTVPLIGVSARLVPIKDHATLLEAMVRLSQAHLVLLGDGVLRSELKARAANLGLAGRTHFPGWWPDMPGAMADLDVVVLSSLNEGTPVGLIEASAAGRAVVATDVGGTAAVVRDGSTGYLVPPKDPTGFAERLGKLLGDDALRRQMGRAGREWVTTRFGLERMLADTRSVYAELLGQHRP